MPETTNKPEPTPMEKATIFAEAIVQEAPPEMVAGLLKVVEVYVPLVGEGLGLVADMLVDLQARMIRRFEEQHDLTREEAMFMTCSNVSHFKEELKAYGHRPPASSASGGAK